MGCHGGASRRLVLILLEVLLVLYFSSFSYCQEDDITDSDYTGVDTEPKGQNVDSGGRLQGPISSSRSTDLDPDKSRGHKHPARDKSRRYRPKPSSVSGRKKIAKEDIGLLSKSTTVTLGLHKAEPRSKPFASAKRKISPLSILSSRSTSSAQPRATARPRVQTYKKIESPIPELREEKQTNKKRKRPSPIQKEDVLEAVEQNRPRSRFQPVKTKHRKRNAKPKSHRTRKRTRMHKHKHHKKARNGASAPHPASSHHPATNHTFLVRILERQNLDTDTKVLALMVLTCIFCFIGGALVMSIRRERKQLQKERQDEPLGEDKRKAPPGDWTTAARQVARRYFCCCCDPRVRETDRYLLPGRPLTHDFRPVETPKLNLTRKWVEAIEKIQWNSLANTKRNSLALKSAGVSLTEDMGHDLGDEQSRGSPVQDSPYSLPMLKEAGTWPRHIKTHGSKGSATPDVRRSRDTVESLEDPDVQRNPKQLPLFMRKQNYGIHNIQRLRQQRQSLAHINPSYLGYTQKKELLRSMRNDPDQFTFN